MLKNQFDPSPSPAGAAVFAAWLIYLFAWVSLPAALAIRFLWRWLGSQ